MVIDFSAFYEFPNLLDRLAGDAGRNLAATRGRAQFPPLNIGEDDAAIRVRALVPGADLEGLDITLTDKTLVLKGELPVVRGRYYRQERPTGPFQRVVTLNVPIDRDRATATMKDGVLEIVLPKAQAVKPRTVHIEVR